MHRNPWKSDISVFINDKRIGIWTSPADLAGAAACSTRNGGRLYPPSSGCRRPGASTGTEHVDNVRVSDLTS